MLIAGALLLLGSIFAAFVRRTVLIAAEFLWLTIVSAKAVNRGGDPWQTGDWLIDLAAGPVRRGQAVAAAPWQPA